MGADIAASVTEDGHCNGKHHSGKHKKHHSKGLSFDSVGDLAMALPLSPWPAIKTGFSRAALMLQLAIKLWTYLGIGRKQLCTRAALGLSTGWWWEAAAELLIRVHHNQHLNQHLWRTPASDLLCTALWLVLSG
jgi:hypothetical protein